MGGRRPVFPESPLRPGRRQGGRAGRVGRVGGSEAGREWPVRSARVAHHTEWPSRRRRSHRPSGAPPAPRTSRRTARQDRPAVPFDRINSTCPRDHRAPAALKRVLQRRRVRHLTRRIRPESSPNDRNPGRSVREATRNACQPLDPEAEHRHASCDRAASRAGADGRGQVWCISLPAARVDSSVPCGYTASLRCLPNFFARLDAGRSGCAHNDGDGPRKDAPWQSPAPARPLLATVQVTRTARSESPSGRFRSSLRCPICSRCRRIPSIG